MKNGLYSIHSVAQFFAWSCVGLVIVFWAGCKEHSQKEADQPTIRKIDLVYPWLDTENSRWFFFSSACRPFGMVNLSPDTKVNGAWGSGYRYETDTIRGFSHIHAWQLAGLSVMPIVYTVTNLDSLLMDVSSPFSHEKERVHPGYHQLVLDRYHIGAELTSTKRVGFHRYVFPASHQHPAIAINLSGQLGPSEITKGELRQINATTFEGSLVNAPTFRRPKDAPVFFHIELNKAAELSDSLAEGKWLLNLKQQDTDTLLMKVGLSYTSVENARLNVEAELPGWNFDQVVADSEYEWESMLSRIDVSGGSEDRQRRFYTDLWHALQGRRVISDANGAYPDHTGKDLRIGQLPLDSLGHPLFNHYNSDAFWGAQWTINTLWDLVYPEIAEEFVNSLLQYYLDGGMIPRGPSGGNYTFVMTGASSTPFIVSAYQKGLRNFDIGLAYQALKKNHMPGGIMERAGYEHQTSLGGGLGHYLKNGYVPYPIPEGEFGSHQDGASLTLEYAYQDWTLAQLAKALGESQDYDYFMNRSQNYRHVFDTVSGWMRPRDVSGQWLEPFDPYAYEHGFNESNSSQSTWFVPQDLLGLASLMGGNDAAVQKLNAQFEEAEKLGFTSGTTHDKERHPEYSRIPINYGNQPSIQTAFIFSYLGRPDLTQYWSRKVVNAVYEGLSTRRGYNGDEDQGLMGSLAVLMKIGLFQMNGGTEENPVYEIGSPVFDRITIQLNPDYYPGKTLTIATEGNTESSVYVHSATWNDAPVAGIVIHHQDLVAGGILKLKMTNQSRH